MSLDEVEKISSRRSREVTSSVEKMSLDEVEKVSLDVVEASGARIF
jgi:hypothetical protein